MTYAIVAFVCAVLLGLVLGLQVTKSQKEGFTTIALDREVIPKCFLRDPEATKLLESLRPSKPQHPEAFGVCDRCGFWFNLIDLKYQHEWRGPRLMNIRLRVCNKCMDVPFIFAKPIIYPPDPVPVRDPRPQNFEIPDNGSPAPNELPWPVQQSGPPAVGRPPPVYVTPPLPLLPQNIEGEP